MRKHDGKARKTSDWWPLTTNLVDHSFWMVVVVVVLLLGGVACFGFCFCICICLCFWFSLDLSQAEAEDLSVACGASCRIETSRFKLMAIPTFVLRAIRFVLLECRRHHRGANIIQDVCVEGDGDTGNIEEHREYGLHMRNVKQVKQYQSPHIPQNQGPQHCTGAQLILHTYTPLSAFPS
jgi:hypothetical protein